MSEVRPTFGVPTKSMGGPSIEWLQNRGVQVPTSVELFDRIGYVDLPTEEFDLLRARPKEVPDRVFCGDSIMGITCTDGLVESRRELTVVEKLGFAACQMQLMVSSSSSVEDVSQLNGAKVITSYPEATRIFFEENGVELAEIMIVGGAAEGMLRAPVSRPDAVVDLVETGDSQRANNLRVVADMGKQQAVLVENPELVDRYAEQFASLRVA